MQVVEIVVRFGETIVDVVRLDAGDHYRVGTGPDVDLAVELAGLRSFPIVDEGFLLRCPIGIAATYADGTAMLATQLRMRLGDDLAVTLGGVTLRIAMVEAAPALPRAFAVDRPAVAYAVASLVVHLVAVIAVTALADPESLAAPVDPMVTVMASLPEPPPPLPDPAKPRMVVRARAAKPRRVAVIAVDTAPSIEADPVEAPKSRQQAIAGARKAGILARGFTADQIRAITGTVDLAKAMENLDPLYLEFEAQEKQFGGGRRFDPTKDPRFASVQTGRYATVATAGEHYDLAGTVKPKPPRVEACGERCTADGGTDLATVRTALARAPIASCFERGDHPRVELVASFAIDLAGRVRDVHVRGPHTVTGCVTGVVQRLAFAPARATRVTSPIAVVW